MLFSIIVPCYNCDTTIGRLLESIVIQNENDLEVILVDDTESHSFVKEVNPYKSKLNIKIVSTDLHYHTPGNSRNYGLDAAAGDWVLFIDCDDTLRENALNTFKIYINTQYSPCYFGLMKQFHQDGTEFDEQEDYQSRHLVWLHGKCYNREFLNKHNVRFKPDMKACEDYFFNYQVYAHTVNDGLSFIDVPHFVYNWLWNDNSLSRSNLYHMSIREHFYDHIYSSLIPWISVENNDNTQQVFQRYIQFLIIDYFLYQYFNKNGIFFKVDIVKYSFSKLLEVFGVSILDVINCVESNYDLWIDGYNKACGIIDKTFVCPQSFRDWILNMCK